MKKSGCLGCFVPIFLVILNISIGAWSVQEILSWFHIAIPTIGNLIIGLFTGEITIPIAVCGWVLKFFGAISFT
ncbi:hypothetical protein BJV85_002817 [Clostridium acetobutylicum]|uniref:Predicted membrane protein n=1 Tax=Clostridium acetobutylicum (strain ATCC 824 / DSM 792 / JCM 1419 / IAM 19013 / LMG 5710 / NBRC 13948 / NRRL B-527 / VKM B-1787 / 2291 / W) TaxID=272562 RepID=Q97JU3_CLOAB|nr:MULTISPECIES: hypothetical protein [Clostridium]AAK79152.1 Predicted membrane protein [Clostridium acetobutylicum ATCC 824]ADZ20230.1 membrane protein [Clostridium acetobutylicum EA 2018]AEI31687.1 hypothetical protein SMB_G1200 [Clostridium acetobutylicum DSM 1731]AWV81595.1 hypothetical protein DK921_16150 [Clostridium acetobutylicum]MBC2393236.1 hypothetical protein [Clostridium acetobutylicum]